jgi:hypothetical protein
MTPGQRAQLRAALAVVAGKPVPHGAVTLAARALGSGRTAQAVVGRLALSRALSAGRDLPLSPEERTQLAETLALVAEESEGEDGDGRRDRVVQIRLSDAEHGALLAAAAAAGLTVSEYLRSRVAPA